MIVLLCPARYFKPRIQQFYRLEVELFQEKWGNLLKSFINFLKNINLKALLFLLQVILVELLILKLNQRIFKLLIFCFC